MDKVKERKSEREKNGIRKHGLFSSFSVYHLGFYWSCQTAKRLHNV